MSGPVWIDEREARALHDRLLALDGGAEGLRDDGSTKIRSCPGCNKFTRTVTNPTSYALAAAYTVGIIRNHPFVDGNKRTGFIVGVLFLEMNGYRFTATEEDARQKLSCGLAAGTLDETGFSAWMHANVSRTSGIS